MYQTKINYLLSMCLLILLFGACKKLKKGDTVLNVKVYNAVTNEPFSNTSIRIDRNKNDVFLGQHYDYLDEHVWRGKTDYKGEISYKFRAKSNRGKFFYTFNLWDLPMYDNYASESYAFFDEPYDRNIKEGQINNREIKLVKMIKYVWHIKNIDCKNADDRIEIRYKGYYHDWWKFEYLPDDGNGCIDLVFPVINQKQDLLYIEKTITKNGLTQVAVDTVKLLGINNADTIKVFY